MKTITAVAGFFLIVVLFVGPHLETDFLNGFYTTLKWMAVYLASGMAGLLLIRKDLPRPTGIVLWLFLGMTAAKILSTLLNVNWVTMVDLLHYGIFAVFVLAFQLMLKEKNSLAKFFWYFEISILILVTRSSLLFIQCRIADGNQDPVCFSGAFGNINMISEFFLLALPLAAYFLETYQKNSGTFKKGLVYFTTTMMVFFLLAGWSRSAWLGLALYTILILIDWKKKQLICVAVGGALFAGSLFVSSMGPDYAKAKEGSFNKRSELYGGASRMLMDSPLGLGPGQFEYNYVPYQRDTKEVPVFFEVYTSPHSEILKWGIENGWAFLLFALGILLYLFGTLFRDRKKTLVHHMCLAVLLTLAPHIAFQFPFDNSMGFLWSAFFLAIYLNLVPQVTITRRWFPAAAVVCSLIAFWHFAMYSQSRYLESRYPTDAKILTTACELYPANWKACFWRAKAQLMSAFPSDAMPLLQEELQRRPFNFEALFFMAQAKSITPDAKGTCEMVKVYDYLFSRGPELDPVFYEKCKPFPMPFPYITPSQFRADYQKWIWPYIGKGDPWPWVFNPQIVRDSK